MANTMSRTELQVYARSRTIRAQQIERLLKSPKFKVSFDVSKCQAIDSHLLASWITDLDLDAIRIWIHQNTKHTVEEMTVRELRKMAQHAGVKNYMQLNKSQLLSEVKASNDRRNPKTA